MEERSAGAVLFSRSRPGAARYLLLKYPAGHWDLTKGNIEKGEEPLETARREVREETGIDDLRMMEGFQRTIEYYYMRRGRRVHKTVVFFLAEAFTERVVLSSEHQDYSWFEFEEALRTVTYPNAKKLIREADAFLRNA